MTRPAFLARVGGILSLLFLSLGAYLLLIRPWHLRWGATDEEVSRPLPGDEVVPSPTFNATRAVTIRARPFEIWPWIAQIGFERAGFYSYDWFDNAGGRSAERIVPELQRLEVGDEIPISSAVRYSVRSLDPPRSMVWVSGDVPPSGTWVWSLEPIDERHTRLVTRMRGAYHWKSPAILLELLVDWGDFAFMRRCMLGIQQRSEGRVTESFAGDLAEGVQWAVAFFEFLAAVALVMWRRQWWRPWTVALATAAVFLLIFYARPPLWLGALSQAVILGGLLWSYRSTASVKQAP